MQLSGCIFLVDCFSVAIAVRVLSSIEKRMTARERKIGVDWASSCVHDNLKTSW
jgi:hypothetical protein